MHDDITSKDLQEGIKTFHVVFWITEGGSVTIKADTKRQAEEKLEAYLNMYSKDKDLDEVGGFNCFHREWEVMDQTQEIT